MGLTWPLGARWLVADGRDPFKVHPAHPPPAQRRQPSFLSPSTSSAHFVIARTRRRAELDARVTFSSTAAIKKGLRVIDEGLWPRARAVVSGHGPDDRTSYACTVLCGLVRQILFSVKSVYSFIPKLNYKLGGDWGRSL